MPLELYGLWLSVQLVVFALLFSGALAWVFEDALHQGRGFVSVLLLSGAFTAANLLALEVFRYAAVTILPVNLAEWLLWLLFVGFTTVVGAAVAWLFSKVAPDYLHCRGTLAAFILGVASALVSVLGLVMIMPYMIVLALIQILESVLSVFG